MRSDCCSRARAKLSRNRVEQRSRQQPKHHAGGVPGRPQPNVGSGPYKAIRFIDCDPGRLIVEAQPLLRVMRDFHSQVRSGWRRVRDRQDRHDSISRTLGHYHDYCTRAVLDAFFPALPVLGIPKIRIADHKAGYRIRQRQRPNRLLRDRTGLPLPAPGRRGWLANPLQ